ncbi:hypothetical protein Fmac_031621 [Flemingia macrophylla]|uniref:BZIP domain-containing protein n=1 Tax=Flemingia macrophylla TaxID=520843 RepID=A0ABD1L2K9_9FABA
MESLHQGVMGGNLSPKLVREEVPTKLNLELRKPQRQEREEGESSENERTQHEKECVGMVSPNRAQGPQYPPMVRQGSLYNLTFDEVQSQLGNTGKSLHSLNLDEIHKNVISAESGQLVQDPSFILSNIGLNGTTSNKTNTGTESWRGIVHQDHVNSSMDTHLQQPNLGETLENFLRAGMINVGGDHDNVNVVGDAQPVVGIDPMVTPSQHEHWLQMQIPGINIHQPHHHQEQQHQQIIESCPDFNVSKTFYENPVMEIGYSESSVGISMSPAYSDSKSAVFGKNRFSDEVLKKTTERRQKRMAKNRESAARSRAKKQEHINKLEREKFRLQKMNSSLKKQKELDAELFSATTLTPRYQLRRTSSSTF